ARRAVLRAVSSDARRGLDHLPHGVWTTADGDPTSPGLADRVCPTGRRASGTVSHLRSAARVYQRHPAWRCAPPCTGWGTRGMRAARETPLGEVRQGGGGVGGGPGGSAPPAGNGPGG